MHKKDGLPLIHANLSLCHFNSRKYEVYIIIIYSGSQLHHSTFSKKGSGIGYFIILICFTQSVAFYCVNVNCIHSTHEISAADLAIDVSYCVQNSET